MRRVLYRFPEGWRVMPFNIVAKPQVRIYCVREVLGLHVPKLQRGHDGLVFICADVPVYHWDGSDDD